MLLFVKVFFTEFIAEMGDKTQLMLIALTSKYKLRDIILGTATAILVLNGLAVLAGGLVSEFIPNWLIKTIAALDFFILPHQLSQGMMTMKRKRGANQRLSLHHWQFFAHSL